MDLSINQTLAEHDLSIAHNAVMIHELMKELRKAGVLRAEQLQAIENRVSDRTGAGPASWT